MSRRVPTLDPVQCHEEYGRQKLRRARTLEENPLKFIAVQNPVRPQDGFEMTVGIAAHARSLNFERDRAGRKKPQGSDFAFRQLREQQVGHGESLRFLVPLCKLLVRPGCETSKNS